MVSHSICMYVFDGHIMCAYSSLSSISLALSTTKSYTTALPVGCTPHHEGEGAGSIPPWCGVRGMRPAGDWPVDILGHQKKSTTKGSVSYNLLVYINSDSILLSIYLCLVFRICMSFSALVICCSSRWINSYKLHAFS